MPETLLALLLALPPSDASDAIQRGWERCEARPVACEAYLAERLDGLDPRTAELRRAVRAELSDRRGQ